MTEAEQEKIEDYRERREDILRILDEIVEIIRFQDRPEDAVHLVQIQDLCFYTSLTYAELFVPVV